VESGRRLAVLAGFKARKSFVFSKWKKLLACKFFVFMKIKEICRSFFT